MVDRGTELPIPKQIFEGTGKFTTAGEHKRIAGQLQRLRDIDWHKKLTKPETGFRGDPLIGAELMKSFVQGEVDVITALQKRGMIQPGYNVPDTHIQQPNPFDNFSAAYLSKIKATREEKQKLLLQEILVSPYFLNNLSRYDTEKIIEMRSKDSEVSLQASPKDIGYIIGIEEAAHSIYEWNMFIKTGDLIYPDPSSISLAAYDATPVEYHGLGWQIRGIMDREDMPQEMKEVVLRSLQRRMKEAIAYRNEHRAEHGLQPQKEKARVARSRLKEFANKDI